MPFSVVTTGSVKSRIIFTFLISAIRSVISFLTGILVARSLGPDRYGDYTFLIGSFAAIRQFFDLGTSGAFYTFICSKPRGAKFIHGYLAWQVLQLALTFVVIALLMPQGMLREIWVGQDRTLVLYALFAVFIQQQIWPTIIQVGESFRLTHRAQMLNLLASATNLIVLLAAWAISGLTIQVVFGLTVVQYLLMFGVAYRSFPVSTQEGESLRWREILREYYVYCSPLVLYSVMSFLYSFGDTWLLQKFGGSKEQAYYSVANQIAMVSLLATTAVLNIFWKEIAEAEKKRDFDRVTSVYLRVTRILFFIGAAASAFLIPWSRELTLIALGPQYVEGATVLAVMLLYPIHQCVGQLNGTMFFATGRTRSYMYYGVTVMAVSIPVSYFMLAPSDALVPGLGMGALGRALRMVVLNALSVTVSGYWLARIYRCRFDWAYQWLILGLALLLGYGTALASRALFHGLPAASPVPLIVLAMALAAAAYSLLMLAVIWLFPSAVGMSRTEFKALLSHFPLGRRIEM